MAYLPVSEEPLVYILGPDSLLFDFRGAYTLIDSGDSPITLTKHIRQVNCLLIPAPSANTVQNAMHQNENRVVPVVGSVPIKELNQKMEQQGIPMILAKQSDKYEPMVLFKNLNDGRLELTVLDGGQKPSIDALQKTMAKGDPLDAVAEKFGMIFVLIWYPSKLNDKVRRVLYTGSATTERVIAALEKASSLTILQTPSATTGQANAGIAPPPKNKVTTTFKPNGVPIAKPALSRPAGPKVPAPSKPPIAGRGPAKEVLKPPPANTTARPARPSTTTSLASPRAKPTSTPSRPVPAPTKKAVESPAVKKNVAPVRGAAPSKPVTTVTRKPEPKKTELKPLPSSKVKEAPKPKDVPKSVEHVPPVVSPHVDSTQDRPLVTIEEPRQPTDQSSSVPVSQPGDNELAPEVRVIPATPEPPHNDEDDHKPQVSEHHDGPVPSAPSEPLIDVTEPISPAPEEPKHPKKTEPEPAPGFKEPYVPQPTNDNGLLDDVEEPMKVRKISMDTDHTEELDKLCQDFEQKNKVEENGHESFHVRSAMDNLLSGIPLDSNQLVDSAIAASLAQTVLPNQFHDDYNKAPVTNGGHSEHQEHQEHKEHNETDKIKTMQFRSSVVEAIGDNKVYEEPDKALDDILSHVTDQSEQEDRRQSQDNEGFNPVDLNNFPSHPMHMVVSKIKPSLKNDRYFELVTVPHKGQNCALENFEEARDFFRTVRSTVYVLASNDIAPFVLEGWLDGKKSWQKPEIHCSICPSVSTPAIQAFSTSHREELEQQNMTVCPSISNTHLRIQTDDGPEEFKTVKMML